MTRQSAWLLLVLGVLVIIACIYGWSAAGRPSSSQDAWNSIRSSLQGDPTTTNPPRPTLSTNFEPHAFDWPQWRGPERTGVSRETGLLRDWPASGPSLAWQADYVGAGFSAPTVAGGRVFLMGNRGLSEYVIALSEEDGGLIWATAIGPIRATGGGYPGPRCSPAVDDDRVYALGLNGDFVCLNAPTGRIKWRRDLRDFDGEVGSWGYSESPLVDGDKVLCTPGGKKATLLALRSESGEVVWKCSVPSLKMAAYGSMIAAEVEGKRQYIQALQEGVVGVSDAGKSLWLHPIPPAGSATCTTPLFHDGVVIAPFQAGTVALTGLDLPSPQRRFFSAHLKNQYGGVVVIEGHVYGADDTLLTCLDEKTGERKWSERRTGKGSIAGADGMLYFRDDNGSMLLVEANPAKYIEHGRFLPGERSGEPPLPHPVIANGKLYLRDQQFLLCYDVKRP
jgi:outer membrane protein assembly factor BamB